MKQIPNKGEEKQTKTQTDSSRILGPWSRTSLALAVILIVVMVPLTNDLGLGTIEPGYATCTGSGTKRVATSENFNSGSHWGEYSQNTPRSGSLCGTSWSEGSLIHLATGGFTSSDGTSNIEVNVVLWLH